MRRAGCFLPLVVAVCVNVWWEPARWWWLSWRARPPVRAAPGSRVLTACRPLPTRPLAHRRYPPSVKMMSRSASVARVAVRAAVRAPAPAARRTMATKPSNPDPLLAGEGWVMRFEQKPLQVETGHAVWDPNNKSNGYSASWLWARGGAACVRVWLSHVCDGCTTALLHV